MTFSPGELDRGVHAFIGEPRTGKTHRAMVTLLGACTARRCGAVIVDSARADNFERMPHVPLRDALAIAYRGRVACWSPRERDEFEGLWRARRSSIEAASDRGVRDNVPELVVLVDELHLWTTDGRCPELEAVARTAHHNRATLLLTSQRIGRDLPRAVLGSAPKVRVFRMTLPPDVRTLVADYGCDAELVRTLRDREWIRAGSWPASA